MNDNPAAEMPPALIERVESALVNAECHPDCMHHLPNTPACPGCAARAVVAALQVREEEWGIRSGLYDRDYWWGWDEVTARGWCADHPGDRLLHRYWAAVDQPGGAS